MRAFAPIFTVLSCLSAANAFAPQLSRSSRANVLSVPAHSFKRTPFALHMSEDGEDTTTTVTPTEESSAPTMPPAPVDPMEQAMLEQEEKARRADELRAQEVFMKKSTGKYRCGNCDWEYDEEKGDTMMIGGTIPAGTKFEELPNNWRCPTCRATKDSFEEVAIEIPGFEVNQGYGFGGNSMTSGQKSGLIFGGLGVFFLLFILGYGLS